MDFESFDLFNAAPGEVLALLVDVEPSPWVMSMLCSIDRSRLSDSEAVAFLQVHQRLTAWLAAIGLDAVLPAASIEPLVEEFTVLVPDSDEERTIRIADVRREELACALRLPPRSPSSGSIPRGCSPDPSPRRVTRWRWGMSRSDTSR